ncbi:MAG: ABC transporter substrate-binding protein [Ruminococcaceae bacterium]|nr:ABC transporter substrate-binding protein [Oscillospiraceae bacterium]
MLIKRFAVLFAVIVAVLFSGCSGNGSTEKAAEGAIVFTDDLGRTVTVDSPKRVAAFLGSFAEIWYLAGGEIIAAPDDAWEDFDLPLSDETVNLGKINDLSLEMLFTADPDFVIASSNIRVDLEWLDTLEDTEITVAYFDVSNFEDYLRMLKICTEITGRDDLYQKNGTDIESRIDDVIKQSSLRVEEKGAPTVLSLRASSASIRAKNSEGNVLGEMLASLGCINIADSEQSLLENLSIEYIIKCDPDYIFFVQIGDNAEKSREKIEAFIAENPAWSELTAVKEGRVFYMDKRLYNNKPNSRWGEAYEGLEKILSEN